MIKKLVFTTAAVGIFLSLAVVAMYLLYPRAINSASRFALKLYRFIKVTAIECNVAIVVHGGW